MCLDVSGDVFGCFRYLVYWKQRLREEPPTAFCSVIMTNMDPKDIGEKEQYFLLSDVLEEDKHIREYLQKKKLVRQ